MRMPIRTIELSERQSALVDSLVSSGRYETANDVLVEAVDLLEEQERDLAHKRSALREAIQLGQSDIDAGRYTDFATPEALRAHLRELFAAELGSSPAPLTE
jgi:antitoxin ParD1/3/4